MENKYKIPLVLFLLGMLFTIVGALLKIQYMPYSNLVLILGMLTEAIAIILLLRVLLKKSK